MRSRRGSLDRGQRCRARDLGIAPGTLTPGLWNAITDVSGVCVGHCTLIEGQRPLVPGHGPVRTGVTALIPHQGDVSGARWRQQPTSSMALASAPVCLK